MALKIYNKKLKITSTIRKLGGLHGGHPHPLQIYIRNLYIYIYIYIYIYVVIRTYQRYLFVYPVNVIN